MDLGGVGNWHFDIFVKAFLSELGLDCDLT